MAVTVNNFSYGQFFPPTTLNFTLNTSGANTTGILVLTLGGGSGGTIDADSITAGGVGLTHYATGVWYLANPTKSSSLSISIARSGTTGGVSYYAAALDNAGNYIASAIDARGYGENLVLSIASANGGMAFALCALMDYSYWWVTPDSQGYTYIGSTGGDGYRSYRITTTSTTASATCKSSNRGGIRMLLMSIREKTTPTITSNPSVGKYIYGESLSVQTLSGGSANVAGSFSWSNPYINPEVGYTNQTVIFTPTDTINYKSVSFNITVETSKRQCISHTLPTASSIFYGDYLAYSTLTGGSAKGESLRGIGLDAIAIIPGTFDWNSSLTIVTSVGTIAYSVYFTPTDTTRYMGYNVSVNVVVNKATPTISTKPTPSGISYGQSLASSTLSGGVASVAGVFSWTTSSTVPDIGASSQGVTFTPTDTTHYNNATTTVTITVSKAISSITTPPTSSSIDYGKTLSYSTLTGGQAQANSANISGSFSWTYPSTVPPAETSSQSITFTPTDSTRYTTATTTITIYVMSTSGQVIWW